eukprot:jgi/Botrbrau1/15531/Bobra.0123s0007.1
MLAVGSCVHRGGIALPRAAPVCGSRTALLGSQRFRRRYSHPRSSRQGTVRTMAMETDNASVLVCGGGGVALEVARILKDKGAWVWVLQRSDSRRGDIEGMLATLVKGDAMKKDDVKKAFEQIEDLDVVISTIGGTPANPAADSEGNINLIDAAAEHGVKKFVLVTSIGTGNSKSAPPANVYEVLQPVLLEKEKAEERLKVPSGLPVHLPLPSGLPVHVPSVHYPVPSGLPVNVSLPSGLPVHVSLPWGLPVNVSLPWGLPVNVSLPSGSHVHVPLLHELW